MIISTLDLLFGTVILIAIFKKKPFMRNVYVKEDSKILKIFLCLLCFTYEVKLLSSKQCSELRL